MRSQRARRAIDAGAKGLVTPILVGPMAKIDGIGTSPRFTAKNDAGARRQITLRK